MSLPCPPKPLAVATLLVVGALGLVGLIGLTHQAEARREVMSPEQKQQLERAERLLVEVVAITDRGPTDPGPLVEVVTRRLREIGYTVVTDPARPHDLLFRVKCEQRKAWEGTLASGGDADVPDSPSRVWKGPACQLTYLLNGKKTGWQKEVRTDFADAAQAAAAAKAGDPGAFALAKLKDRLDAYDFPIRAAAEWGQEARLLNVLQQPGTSKTRTIETIGLLGDLFSAKAIPRLVTALKDSDTAVASAAAVALGNIGQKDSVQALSAALKSGQPEVRVAAAKGLGLIGALHGDYDIVPPLLDALPTTDLTLKIEVVTALGKLPDRRAHEPLLTLQRSLRNMRTSVDGSKEPSSGKPSTPASSRSIPMTRSTERPRNRLLAAYLCAGLLCAGWAGQAQAQAMGDEAEMERLRAKAEEAIATNDPESAAMHSGKAALMAARLSKLNKDQPIATHYRGAEAFLRAQEHTYRALALFQRAGGTTPASAGVCYSLTLATQSLGQALPLLDEGRAAAKDTGGEKLRDAAQEWKQTVDGMAADYQCR